MNKELSLLAKEKGFDEPCLKFYSHWHNDKNKLKLWSEYEWDTNGHTEAWVDIQLPAPLYQQIISYLNKKGKELHLDIYIIFDGLKLQETNEQILEALNKL